MHFSSINTLDISGSPTNCLESFFPSESPLMPTSTTAPVRAWLLNVSQACKGSSIENIQELKKLGNVASSLNIQEISLKQKIESIVNECLKTPPKQSSILKLVQDTLKEFISSPGSPRRRTWSSGSC